MWAMDELMGNQWLGDLLCQDYLLLDGLSGSHGLCRKRVWQVQGWAPGLVP